MVRRAAGTLAVAAGALIDVHGRVLLARRRPEVHQGGLWEFPGGKCRAAEGWRAALARELQEELGISVERARPLIRVDHPYPERRVLLDVWRVEVWRGEATGREGQALRWVAPERLGEMALPPADRPVVSALRLPDTCLVTPDPESCGGPQGLVQGVRRAVEAGVRLVRLRARSLAPDAYGRLAAAVHAACAPRGVLLMLDARCPAPSGGEVGVHLDARRLRAAEARPAPAGRWLSASCHDAAELEQARRIGVDFVFLGPVRRTASHPGALPVGWRRFALMARAANLPVYALGGVGRGDLERAWRHGAQGIAAIRGLWPGGTAARTPASRAGAGQRSR